MRLFWPIYSYKSDLATKLYGKAEIDESLIEKELGPTRRKEYIERYKKCNIILVNDQKVPYEAKRYHHLVTGQFGLLTY